MPLAYLLAALQVSWGLEDSYAAACRCSCWALEVVTFFIIKTTQPSQARDCSGPHVHLGLIVPSRQVDNLESLLLSSTVQRPESYFWFSRTITV